MEVLASSILAAILILISVQDVRTLKIADSLNTLLACVGVIWWLWADPAKLGPQISAALFAALLLWSVRSVHAKLTGRIGLGLGDVKLIGAGMVWINPYLFPLLLFTASAAGLVGAFSVSSGGTEGLRSRRIPFGPCLAFGILVCWFLEMTR